MSLRRLVNQENGDPSMFKIGLGLHNVSGYTQWSEEEWEKHIIHDIFEVRRDLDASELKAAGKNVLELRPGFKGLDTLMGDMRKDAQHEPAWTSRFCHT